MTRDDLARLFEDERPRLAPCLVAYSDARFAKRRGGRRTGGVAAAGSLRRRRDREPRRLAHHGGGQVLPRPSPGPQRTPADVVRRRPGAARRRGAAPDDEAELADTVGLALLVVLETLSPAERLAFVLHDLFAVPFDEIGRILGKSADATKMMASRARRKVRAGDGTGNRRRAEAAGGRGRLPRRSPRRRLRGSARGAGSGRGAARRHARWGRGDARSHRGRRPGSDVRRARRRVAAGARGRRYWASCRGPPREPRCRS